MRPGGKDGRLYRIVYGAEIKGSASVTKVPKEGFYKISAIAGTGSSIPKPDNAIQGGLGLGVGNIFFAKKDHPLAAGDNLIPLELHLISFVTDVQDNAQGQTFDVTTQADVESGVRSYIPSAFKERSGSISGFVDVDSQEQKELFGEFREIVIEDVQGNKVTRRPSKALEHEFMMSRREAAPEGETEMWEYMPIVCESINTSKPMDGTQPFSFNYKVDGKRKPSLIYISK